MFLLKLRQAGLSGIGGSVLELFDDAATLDDSTFFPIINFKGMADEGFGDILRCDWGVVGHFFTEVVRHYACQGSGIERGSAPEHSEVNPPKFRQFRTIVPYIQA
jgi:hypothetical protein